MTRLYYSRNSDLSDEDVSVGKGQKLYESFAASHLNDGIKGETIRRNLNRTRPVSQRHVFDVDVDDYNYRKSILSTSNDPSPLHESVPFQTPGHGHEARCNAEGSTWRSDLTFDQKVHLELLGTHQNYESLKNFRDKPDLFRYIRPRSSFPYKVMIGASRGMLVLAPKFETDKSVCGYTGDNLPTMEADSLAGTLNVHNNLTGDYITWGGIRNTSKTTMSLQLNIPCGLETGEKDRIATVKNFTIKISDILKEVSIYAQEVKRDKAFNAVHNIFRSFTEESILSNILIYVEEINVFISLAALDRDELIKKRVLAGVVEATAWLSTVNGEIPELRSFTSPYRAYSRYPLKQLYVLDSFGVHTIDVRHEPTNRFEIHRDDYQDKGLGDNNVIDRVIDGQTTEVTTIDEVTKTEKIICVVSSDLDALLEIRDSKEIRISDPQVDKLRDERDTFKERFETLRAEKEALDRKLKNVEIDFGTKVKTLETDNSRLSNKIKLLEDRERENLSKERTKQERYKSDREEVKFKGTQHSEKSSRTIETLKLIGLTVTTISALTIATIKLISITANKEKMFWRSGMDWMTVTALTSGSIFSFGFNGTSSFNPSYGVRSMGIINTITDWGRFLVDGVVSLFSNASDWVLDRINFGTTIDPKKFNIGPSLSNAWNWLLDKIEWVRNSKAVEVVKDVICKTAEVTKDVVVKTYHKVIELAIPAAEFVAEKTASCWNKVCGWFK